MTPGGINGKLHGELSTRGTYAHFETAMDRVQARLDGRTDEYRPTRWMNSSCGPHSRFR